MVSSQQVDEDLKIFISGFPRAGTTMLRRIMLSFDGCRINRKVSEEHPITDVTNYNVKKQPFGYFKRFAPPYNYKELIESHHYKIISMLRDPRDVLVSKHREIGSDIYRYWVEPRIVIRNCKEYLNNIGNPDVLFIRYEDLVRYTEQELFRISVFINRSYNDDYKKWYVFNDEELTIHRAVNSPRKIDTNSIGNWKLEKHKERLESVMTDELKYYIKKLGYE